MALNPPAAIDRRGLTPLVNFDGTFDSDYPNGNKPEPSVDITDLSVVSKTATSVTLSWTGIDEVTALERAASGSGSFAEVKTGIAANTSETTDSDLSASTAYDYRLTFASGTSNTVTVTTNASVSGDWVVFSSNPEYAPLAGYPIYPRPDSETSANAYHRKMHTSRIYRIPFLLQGGGWPVRYEIITAPPGTTIGSELVRSTDSATGMILHERDVSYSILEYDPSGDAQNTIHDFHIRATDQQGNIYDWQSISSEVDNDAYVFLNSETGSDAGAGTENDPLQTFNAGLWKNSDLDSTYEGKIAVFEGSFAISPATDNNVARLSGPKPLALVAGPGGATFDMNNGHFSALSGEDDFACIGIDFDGSRSDQANNRLFGLVGQVNRALFWKNSFDNTNPGTNGGDNPAHIFFGGLGTEFHSDNVVFDCSLGANAGMSLVQSFSCNHLLVERAVGENLSMSASNGTHLVQIKSSNRNVTVRDSFGRSSTQSILFAMSNAGSQGDISSENIELCFCTAIRTDSGSSDPAISWNDGSNYPKHPTIAADYRNTIITASSWAWKFFDVADGIVRLSAAAYVGGIPSFANNYTDVGSVASVQLSASDFDADGKLTGSARSTHLGSIGAEIAAEAT